MAVVCCVVKAADVGVSGNRVRAMAGSLPLGEATTGVGGDSMEAHSRELPGLGRTKDWSVSHADYSWARAVVVATR
jgi:hypothetical protein